MQATLHWVAAADAVGAEVRLYSHLFNRPDPGADGDALADIDPNSLEVLTECLVEPALQQAEIGQAVQFERIGYFAADPDSQAGRPVFNRTVGLRDTWAKLQGAKLQGAKLQEAKTPGTKTQGAKTGGGR